jgi:hypothetical protein
MVELEVAEGLAFVDVALFAEDDLIDQAAAFRERAGKPWDFDRG